MGSLPQYFNAKDGTGHNQWVRMGYTDLPIDPKRDKDATGTPIESARSVDNLDSQLPYMTDLVRHLNEISHTRQKNHTVNVLFQDGHVGLCNDARIFSNPVWEQIEPPAQVIDELTGAYRIFRLIGGKGIDDVK